MSKIKGLVMDLESKLSDSQTEIRKARRKLRGLGVTVEEIHQPNPDVDEDISTNPTIVTGKRKASTPDPSPIP